MTVNEFAVRVTKFEGQKKECSVAQVKEILRVVNMLVGGELYRLIKSLLGR